jgi:hypothetical protein
VVQAEQELHHLLQAHLLLEAEAVEQVAKPAELRALVDQVAAAQVLRLAELQRLELLTQAEAVAEVFAVLAHKLAVMVDQELWLLLIQTLSQR